VTQLVLDLGPPPPPTFGNFVAGDNGEALSAARALLDPARAASRFLYLWGPAASGRSHLLGAIANAAGADLSRRLGPDAPVDAFAHEPAVRLWLVDDCERLDGARQAALFHLFDAVAADTGSALAAAGDRPPARLPTMPELATRLGWGLVVQLHRLSDADTARAVAGTLAERGIAASADLVPWLMTHAPRDLGSLRALIDALDAYALERKRAITVPLVREFAQARAGAPTAGAVGGRPADMP
jgi:DnaA family protein